MLKDIIKQVEESLVIKRNDLRYKRGQIIENMIKSNSKLDTCIMLRYLMETSLSESALIYQYVTTDLLSFNEACIKAGI